MLKFYAFLKLDSDEKIQYIISNQMKYSCMQFWRKTNLVIRDTYLTLFLVKASIAGMPQFH